LEIVNVILNIPITNDGEQYKDNNNSITRYIESNNDKILHLAEKNYEDLVEVLTNNAINAAASSSSNPTLSLSLSSIFSSPYNQSDTCIIEESESFDNSKGDIADDITIHQSFSCNIQQSILYRYIKQNCSKYF
jgi:hypothetical protein